jgi:multiple sugar transport system permease protein
MPNIITAATIAILFRALFGYPMGPMNDLVLSVGKLFPFLHLPQKPVYFLQNKSTAQGVIIFIQTWMWYGNTMIMLIAGVLGISPDIFEASEIDGANKFQTFFYVTLPNIRTILLYVLVTSLIGGLAMFDIPQLFLQGGPDNATLTTSVFIYNQAFKGSYMYNRAAAASMIMFAIMVACSLVLFYIMRDKDEIRIKKEQKAWMKAEIERRKNEGRAS